MSEPAIVARIEGWYLQRLAEGPFVRSYRIVKDSEGYGLMESTIVTEACGHLTLSGDLTPTLGGVSTPRRYGLDWFAGASSPNYLGEKFLQSGYCPWERAKEDIQQWVDEPEDHGLNEEQVEHLQDLLDSGGGNLDEYGVRLYDALDDIDPYLVEEGPPGSGYHPVQLETLCAIQRRFAKLWAAKAVAETEAESKRTGMRMSLNGLVLNAVRDLETYEEGCRRARENGDVSELPDPEDWPAPVQNADSHRCTLVDHLVRHIGMVRDGLRAGDDTPLRQFFDLYVIDGTTGLQPVAKETSNA